jgi:hypothetical protein
MSRRSSIHGLLAIALALLAAIPAFAQPFRRGNPGMMQPQVPRTYKGTLVSAAGGQIQITVDSKPLYVMIGQSTDVSVTGSAEAEYLKPGLEVEFVAEVAKGGVVSQKVDHLTLVTTSTDRPSGLLPPEDASSGKKGGKDEQAAPAGGDAQAAKARNQDAEPPLGGNSKAGKTSKSHSGAPQLPGTFTVRGKLRMYKAGKITVALTHGPLVKAELADNATIDVDMADVRVAQRDDAVTVKGSQVRPGMIAAQSVTIELANPLTGKKKAKSAKTPAAHAKAKGGDAADAPAAGN